ncbi:alcohol oxidase protein [Apiospora arundinis]
MNYTRKRALLACDFCRYRKRKCDGERPCSTCRDSNADCVYKELPADRIEDASPLAVVDRLSRIEALLEQQSQQLQQLSVHSSPAFSPAQRSGSFPLLYQNTSSYSELPRPPEDNPQDTHHFLIPIGVCLTSDLFSAPGVQEQLGEYPRNYFFSIEQKNALPSIIDPLNVGHMRWPVLSESVANELVNSYFLHIHPHQPLFSTDAFGAWQRKASQNVPGYDIEVALCLCVYALGTIAAHTHNLEGEENESTLGAEYFRTALQVILHNYTWSFKPDLITCQALLLASTYFGYLGQPLHCWKMAYLATRMFLDYLETYYQPSFSECDDTELRVFWLCFLVECNQVAELGLTRSGVEPLGDRMPLPRSMDMNSMSDTNDTIGFVAEIALRRLLNRILSSLYSTPEPAIAATNLNMAPTPFPSSPRRFSTDTAVSSWQQQQQQGLSLQKLVALSSELNRQLEQWYDSIPDGLCPPKGVEPIETERGRVLRIRYYEAQHLIHRPFVVQAASIHQRNSLHQNETFSPSAFASSSAAATTAPPAIDAPLIPQVVIDRCEVCIESCVTYLYNVLERLERRSAHLWSLAQNALACVLVLVVAESCPPLRPFVPPAPGVRQIRDTLVARLKRWASSGSSLEADVAILESLRFGGGDGDAGVGGALDWEGRALTDGAFSIYIFL